MGQEPIDLVYTWVDDSFPGYLDVLNQYVADKRDTNPNRTRDNLETIRYSMRSVVKYLPHIRHIYLLTCRAQVPDWLDANHPMIKIVHHDEIIDPAYLPTFNSFAIVSHLHKLPGLSRQFLYFEDDMLAWSQDMMASVQAPDGVGYVNLGKHWITPRSKLNPATSSPWNLALSNVDEILAPDFGPGPRRHIVHGPQLMDCDVMAEAEDKFSDIFTATRAARFRDHTCVPPEVLIPHYALETGRAILADQKASLQYQGYISLENFAPWTWIQLKRQELRNPGSITLNDSFEAAPNPRVVKMVRDRLENWFPVPAPFERAASV